MELTGKVTVVTRSASGLGRATVMQLVSNGASKGRLVGLTLPEEARQYLSNSIPFPERPCAWTAR
jgi:NAD(P)-dependent dehydrogenase (short-subunit alcohol dehydrogenase family)